MSSSSSSSDVKIQDMYSIIPKKFLPKRPTYKNYNKVKIDIPFRMCILGPSGCKKTQLAANLIRIMGCWNKIFIFAKDLTEPIYQFLIDFFDKFHEKTGHQVLYYSNDISELPSPDDLDKQDSNLVIIDDMILEKDLSNVGEYFVRGRKKNCSVMFISQSYFATPKIIRSNCDILCILKINTARDLTRIISEYSLGIDRDKLKRVYKACVDSADQSKFFMIDMSNSNTDLRFRCGFKGIPYHYIEEI